MTGSINLPKVYSPMNHAWLRFCLTLRNMIWNINLPKLCGPHLTLRKMMWSINLPKVCGPRNQVWLRFCLTLRKMLGVTHNVINENMAEKTFINNSTFTGYLYSRGTVQHFYLDLQDNILMFQPLRWYDMVISSWALTFLMLGSW